MAVVQKFTFVDQKKDENSFFSNFRSLSGYGGTGVARDEAHTPQRHTRLTRLLETTPFPTAEELLRALRRLPAAVGVLRGGPASSFLPPLLSCFSRSWGPTEVAAAAGVRPGSY